MAQSAFTNGTTRPLSKICSSTFVCSQDSRRYHREPGNRILENILNNLVFRFRDINDDTIIGARI